MTSLGFKTLYGSGWQLAATKSMYPDIGIYQSHQMVELVLEMRKGIEGARNTRWYDSEGKDCSMPRPRSSTWRPGSAARRRPSPWPPSSSGSAPAACTSRTRTRRTAPAATS